MTSANQSPAESYSERITRGVAWVGFTLGVGRFASFVANLILGWILTPHDFAAVAIALSATTIVSGLRDGGAVRFLVQSGREKDRWTPPVFRMAIAFNALAALLLMALATPVAGFYGSESIAPVLVVFALSIPLLTPSTILRARLQASFRFGHIAQTDSLAIVARYTATVLLAVAGLGAMSFAIAAVVSACFEWWLYRRLSGAVPLFGETTRDSLRTVLGASAWGMATALAIGVTTQGDYLVIGRMVPAETLASYFFGFQLATSVSVMFSSSMRSVLLPALAQMGVDRSRQAKAFLKSIRLLTIAAMPACAVVAFAAGPVIHFLWQGKWDSSIPVAQIIGATLAFRLLTPLTGTLLEAQGAWKARAIFQAIDAATVLLAAYVGATTGGLVAIALAVGGGRAIVGTLQAVVGARAVDLSIHRVLTAIAWPTAAAAAAAIVVNYLSRGLPAAWPWTIEVGSQVFAFALIYGALAWLLFRSSVHEIFDFVRHLRARPRASDVAVEG